jgi:hypothetical protein
MDWAKHAKVSKTPTGKVKERRLTITISAEVQKVFDLFRDHYKANDVTFTDTAILTTFLEAGIRSFIQDQILSRANPSQPTNDTHQTHHPVHQDE